MAHPVIICSVVGSFAQKAQEKGLRARAYCNFAGDAESLEKLTMASSAEPGTLTLATSQEIRDRGSTFVGSIYRANTVDEARGVARRFAERPTNKDQRNVRDEVEDAEKTRRGEDAYAIAAWRCMVVKPGRTGLGGPDEFELGEGWEDGGERWAGKRVLAVMQREGVVDAVVVVRRWFGGTLLGPVRFAHVETCTSEVCRRFRKVEEMAECVQTLNTLDSLLAGLRTELATLRESAAHEPNTTLPKVQELPGERQKAPDYRAMQQALDLTKAKRLIHARERAIENTKTLINKYNTST